MKLLDLLTELKNEGTPLIANTYNIFVYNDFITRLKSKYGARKLIYYIDDIVGAKDFAPEIYCEMAQNLIDINRQYLQNLFTALEDYNPYAEYTDDYSGKKSNTQSHTGTDSTAGESSKNTSATTDSSGTTTAENKSESTGTAAGSASVYAYDSNATEPQIVPNTSDTANNTGSSTANNTSTDSAKSTTTSEESGSNSSTTTYNSDIIDNGADSHKLIHTSGAALSLNHQAYFAAVDYVCQLIAGQICISVGF